ncbi:MAG: hypothetical protein VYA61_08515 [Pseudomonadota bacterium]|nr:hypothetical protein [Pseudomonadota bacterium]
MMENSQISNTKGNKDLKLAPETIRIRDAIVEKYLDVPLDKLSSKLQSLISDETDTATRLGILSARVEILRMRFADITGRAYKKDQGNIGGNDTSEEEQITEEAAEDEKEGWMTLKILEASEVNGVRFPEGVKIDVHADDAKKLLAANKAELLSMKVEDVIEPEPSTEEDSAEGEDDSNETDDETNEDSVPSSDIASTDQLNAEGTNLEEVSDLKNDETDAIESEKTEPEKADLKQPQKETTDDGSDLSEKVITKEDAGGLKPEEVSALTDIEKSTDTKNPKDERDVGQDKKPETTETKKGVNSEAKDKKEV